MFNSQLREMGVRVDRGLVMNLMTMLEGHKYKPDVAQVIDYANSHLIQKNNNMMVM